MNFFTFSLLILTSICFQLSRCCGATPRVHTTTIAIRRVSHREDKDDYLMYGSLLSENIVITTPHYLYDANIDDVFAEADCRKITKKISLSNSCIRRSVSKIIFEDDYNTTKNFMDSIAIVILKAPFIIKGSIQLIPLARDTELLITSKCVHVKWDYLQDIDKVIFYHGVFHKEAFDYQAKFEKTMLISKSTFDHPNFPELKNKTSLYDFILEQDHDIQISHDKDEQYLGTPIVCPHLLNQEMYFQIGMANYFFLVNSKTRNPSKNKKILYYINIINRQCKIFKKIHETLQLDKVQTPQKR